MAIYCATQPTQSLQWIRTTLSLLEQRRGKHVGYLASEMIGKPIDMLLPPDLREAGESETISRSFRAQGAVLSHQTERLTKDGRRIQLIFTRTAIRDDSGASWGALLLQKTLLRCATLNGSLPTRNIWRRSASFRGLATKSKIL